MDPTSRQIDATLGVVSTGSHSRDPLVESTHQTTLSSAFSNRAQKFATMTSIPTTKRALLILGMNVRNLCAVLFFILINVVTLIHDPIATITLVKHHFFMQNQHEAEQEIMREWYCKDSNDSILCLQDELGDLMYPTPISVVSKIKARGLFQDPNITYGKVLYENQLLKVPFHYEPSCNDLFHQGLKHVWFAPEPFVQQCCALTMPTGGMFWNLCTTPPKEAITPEGAKREMELRGTMVHATMGIINSYYKFAGCRVEDNDSIEEEEAAKLSDEEVASHNHLNCIQLEVDFDITDVAPIFAPIITLTGMLITFICRFIKLIKLGFQLILTTHLGKFCYKRNLFLKTFAEDLMYADPLIQKLNVIICLSSLSTLTMHFGLWGVDESVEGQLSALHLVSWSEGIYTAVGMFAKCFRLRISSMNAFMIIAIGARYILPEMARTAYMYVDTTVEAGYTGHYNVDSTITILLTLLEYSLIIVAIQFFMSFCIKRVFDHVFGISSSSSNTSTDSSLMTQFLKRFFLSSNKVEGQTKGYRNSCFELLIGHNFQKFYGFAPVSHHQLLIKGVVYTPLEWVLTAGYFLYDDYLYKTTLGNCIAFITGQRLKKFQAKPIARFFGGMVRPLGGSKGRSNQSMGYKAASGIVPEMPSSMMTPIKSTRHKEFQFTPL